MIVPLIRILRHNPTLLQQILFNFRPLNHPATIKMYINILPKSRTVIIPDGFRIPERLQNRIRLQDLLFYPRMFATDRS